MRTRKDEPTMPNVLAGCLVAGCFALACGTGTSTKSGQSTPLEDASSPGGDGAGEGDIPRSADAEGAGGDAALPAGPECESNDDCAGGGICDCLGACVEAGLFDFECEKDSNCGSGNYCDKCASACRLQKTLCEECVKHEECEDGGRCVDFASGGRYCLRECVADPGCPTGGFSCKKLDGFDSKQCVPLSGTCTKPSMCEKDQECEYGAICNKGKCVPGCPGDDACPTGTICSAFRCVPACGAENPCPDGQECDATGHCKIPGGCLEPKDCPEKETYCDPDEHMCKDGCLQDFDCKSFAKVCENMKCEDKGCTANYYCAYEQVCELDTGACKKAEGPHCEAGCDPESDTACGGKPNWCLKLEDEEGNDLGSYCFVACGPDPKNPCPQGYACEVLEDQDGNEQGKICFRFCNVTPVGVEK